MIRHLSFGLFAALALGLLAVLPVTAARADGPPPATQGSITVHVVDSNNNIVPGATVRCVMVGDRRSVGVDGVVVTSGRRGGVVAVGHTGADGTLEITGLEVAGYNVIARMKDLGRGRAHVEITGGSAGATQASITITLVPSKAQTQP